MKQDPRGVDLASLWAAYKDSDDQDARERLILNYSPLVKYVATACICFAVFYALQIWREQRRTRFLVAVGLLAGFAYAANLRTGTFSAVSLMSSQAIFMLCLLVLIFGRAGTYIGLDHFFHFSLWHKK